MLVGRTPSVHFWKAAWHIPKSQMHMPSEPVIPLNHHPTNTPTRAKNSYKLIYCSSVGKSRRLGSKTRPSLENWFKHKGFPCRGDQSRTMASGSPCWWPLLPGLGWALGCRPAGHGPSPPGLRASGEPHWDPQNISNRSISSPPRRVPGGVARGGVAWVGVAWMGAGTRENSPREAGEGTP